MKLMPKVLTLLFFSVLFIATVLGIYYLYNINFIQISLKPFNLKINRVYSLDEALKSASKDCKVSFPGLYEEHKKITPGKEASPNEETKEEYKKYISTLFEKAGINVGPAPDYRVVDNLEYYNMGSKIPNTQGCWAIIYTKENINYFVYEKSNGNFVKKMVDSIE